MRRIMTCMIIVVVPWSCTPNDSRQGGKTDIIQEYERPFQKSPDSSSALNVLSLPRERKTPEESRREVVGGEDLARVKPEEEAWKAVNKESAESLNAYLIKYPNGTYSEKAKRFLALFEKIEDIRKNRIEPSVVVPFEKLGESWKSLGQKGYVAFLYSREKKEFLRFPSIYIGGMCSGANGTLADPYFSNWVNSAPTGDGSIIAFDTNGEECPIRKSVVVVSQKDNVVYFVVIDKAGLVHLDGKGKVIFPDGSVKILE